MRAVTGNDPSLYQICRSQFPCGTTYGSQISGSAQSGDAGAAKAMIKEAYTGAKASVINPTDFATIAPLGDITYDMFQKLGINTEMVAADWARWSNAGPVKNQWIKHGHSIQDLRC